MRFVPVVASAGLASVALCTAAPEAITQVREPQMRVLLHEGDHVVLRADQTQLMTVRGLPGGTREIRRLQLRRQGGGTEIERFATRGSCPHRQTRSLNEDLRWHFPM